MVQHINPPLGINILRVPIQVPVIPLSVQLPDNEGSFPVNHTQSLHEIPSSSPQSGPTMTSEGICKVNQRMMISPSDLFLK